MTGVKDFIISLILAVVLIVVFSVFGPKEGTTTTITGFAPAYESDSGTVVPGSGSEPLKTYMPEEMQTPDETEPEETTVNKEYQNPVEESKLESKQDSQTLNLRYLWGYDMIVSFLCGIAATLIIEIIALASARCVLRRMLTDDSIQNGRKG